MTSNGSANEAPRETRAKELNNAETGGRNDIMTIILANGASYDFKERVVLRRLSLHVSQAELDLEEVGDYIALDNPGRLLTFGEWRVWSEQSGRSRPRPSSQLARITVAIAAVGLLRYAKVHTDDCSHLT